VRGSEPLAAPFRPSPLFSEVKSFGRPFYDIISTMERATSDAIAGGRKVISRVVAPSLLCETTLVHLGVRTGKPREEKREVSFLLSCTPFPLFRVMVELAQGESTLCSTRLVTAFKLGFLFPLCLSQGH